MTASAIADDNSAIACISPSGLLCVYSVMQGERFVLLDQISPPSRVLTICLLRFRSQLVGIVGLENGDWLVWRDSSAAAQHFLVAKSDRQAPLHAHQICAVTTDGTCVTRDVACFSVVSHGLQWLLDRSTNMERMPRLRAKLSAVGTAEFFSSCSVTGSFAAQMRETCITGWGAGHHAAGIFSFRVSSRVTSLCVTQETKVHGKVITPHTLAIVLVGFETAVKIVAVVGSPGNATTTCVTLAALALAVLTHQTIVPLTTSATNVTFAIVATGSGEVIHVARDTTTSAYGSTIDVQHIDISTNVDCVRSSVPSRALVATDGTAVMLSFENGDSGWRCAVQKVGLAMRRPANTDETPVGVVLLGNTPAMVLEKGAMRRLAPRLPTSNGFITAFSAGEYLEHTQVPGPLVTETSAVSASCREDGKLDLSYGNFRAQIQLNGRLVKYSCLFPCSIGIVVAAVVEHDTEPLIIIEWNPEISPDSMRVTRRSIAITEIVAVPLLERFFYTNPLGTFLWLSRGVSSAQWVTSSDTICDGLQEHWSGGSVSMLSTVANYIVVAGHRADIVITLVDIRYELFREQDVSADAAVGPSAEALAYFMNTRNVAAVATLIDSIRSPSENCTVITPRLPKMSTVFSGAENLRPIEKLSEHEQEVLGSKALDSLPSSEAQLDLVSEANILSDLSRDPALMTRNARPLFEFLLAFARRRLRARQGNQSPLEHVTWCWAVIAESEDQVDLANRVVQTLQPQPRWSEDVMIPRGTFVLGWSSLRELGVAVWMKNPTFLKSLIERIAKSIFASTRDPKRVAMWYVAIGKTSTLAGLCRAASEPKLEAFFSKNFDEKKSKDAALTNAYVALSKGNVEFAIAFFLLGGDTITAVTVALQRGNDWQLGLLIARLITQDRPGASLAELIETCGLRKAIANDSPYAECSLLWVQGDQLGAVQVLQGMPCDEPPLQLCRRLELLKHIRICCHAFQHRQDGFEALPLTAETRLRSCALKALVSNGMFTASLDLVSEWLSSLDQRLQTAQTQLTRTDHGFAPKTTSNFETGTLVFMDSDDELEQNTDIAAPETHTQVPMTLRADVSLLKDLQHVVSAYARSLAYAVAWSRCRRLVLNSDTSADDVASVREEHEALQTVPASIREAYSHVTRLIAAESLEVCWIRASSCKATPWPLRIPPAFGLHPAVQVDTWSAELRRTSTSTLVAIANLRVLTCRDTIDDSIEEESHAPDTSRWSDDLRRAVASFASLYTAIQCLTTDDIAPSLACASWCRAWRTRADSFDELQPHVVMSREAAALGTWGLMTPAATREWRSEIFEYLRAYECQHGSVPVKIQLDAWNRQAQRCSPGAARIIARVSSESGIYQAIVPIAIGSSSSKAADEPVDATSSTATSITIICAEAFHPPVHDVAISVDETRVVVSTGVGVRVMPFDGDNEPKRERWKIEPHLLRTLLPLDGGLTPCSATRCVGCSPFLIVNEREKIALRCLDALTPYRRLSFPETPSSDGQCQMVRSVAVSPLGVCASGVMSTSFVVVWQLPPFCHTPISEWTPDAVFSSVPRQEEVEPALSVKVFPLTLSVCFLPHASVRLFVLGCVNDNPPATALELHVAAVDSVTGHVDFVCPLASARGAQYSSVTPMEQSRSVVVTVQGGLAIVDADVDPIAAQKELPSLLLESSRGTNEVPYCAAANCQISAAGWNDGGVTIWRRVANGSWRIIRELSGQTLLRSPLRAGKPSDAKSNSVSAISLSRRGEPLRAVVAYSAGMVCQLRLD
jgi:hypothetical protein